MTDTTTTRATAEALIAHGYARRWTQAGKDRAYLTKEAILAAMNLKISRYGTGNISYAELDGEKISNSEAKRILLDLHNAAPYVDMLTGYYERRAVSEGYGYEIDDAFKTLRTRINA